MKRAALAFWLLASVAASSASAALPRKPQPAVAKGGPAKSAAGASAPRATKLSPTGHPGASRPQAAIASASPRPLTPGSPRPERAAVVSAVVRPSVEARLFAAREVYQSGRYAEVPTALIKLLTESQLTPPQLAAVYELLGSAYVALGQTELAIRCFGEVLNRRPTFVLDPVRTSPKIRAALDQAHAQKRPQTPSPPVAVPAAPHAM